MEKQYWKISSSQHITSSHITRLNPFPAWSCSMCTCSCDIVHVLFWFMVGITVMHHAQYTAHAWLLPAVPIPASVHHGMEAASLYSPGTLSCSLQPLQSCISIPHIYYYCTSTLQLQQIFTCVIENLAPLHLKVTILLPPAGNRWIKHKEEIEIICASNISNQLVSIVRVIFFWHALFMHGSVVFNTCSPFYLLSNTHSYLSLTLIINNRIWSIIIVMWYYCKDIDILIGNL